MAKTSMHSLIQYYAHSFRERLLMSFVPALQRFNQQAEIVVRRNIQGLQLISQSKDATKRGSNRRSDASFFSRTSAGVKALYLLWRC